MKHFNGHYTTDEILTIISQLNETLTDREIFPPENILFTIEMNEWFLEIKFNGQSVISTENTCDWEYDYENDCWEIYLINYLSRWLIKQKELFNKIQL